MNDTQVPIIAWEKRYMTPRECARLQSMEDLPQLPAVKSRAFSALGNAVNTRVVERVARALLSGDGDNSRKVLPAARASVATFTSAVV